MINPPQGSFSWIPERYVKRVNDTTGEVAEESVIAFVGSEFGDEASVFQRPAKDWRKTDHHGTTSNSDKQWSSVDAPDHTTHT